MAEVVHTSSCTEVTKPPALQLLLVQKMPSIQSPAENPSPSADVPKSTVSWKPSCLTLAVRPALQINTRPIAQKDGPPTHRHDSLHFATNFSMPLPRFTRPCGCSHLMAIWEVSTPGFSPFSRSNISVPISNSDGQSAPVSQIIGPAPSYNVMKLLK
ncbi:hypothetical protein AVEN_47896-1 [Araneus ventricosus]|uniref:Uncharacterized protein n=1 Tax=Araneus ventricosus TaxID=182803 RepID=A0A4Y2QKS7_ARAVE|nr:hypothetical protein AVEN_47896-1 [Araneus ventricosus]